MSTKKNRADLDRFFAEQVYKAASSNQADYTSINLDELTATMGKLAEQYPDWRGHLPHDAAVNFNSNEAYQEKFGEHVDGCGFCQQLIETFDPPEAMLGEVLSAIPKTATSPADDDIAQCTFDGEIEFDAVPADSTHAAPTTPEHVLIAAFVDDRVVVAGDARVELKQFGNVMIASDEQGERTRVKVGTKLDLAKAYIDMGDPDGAKGILRVAVGEGEEAEALLDKLQAS